MPWQQPVIQKMLDEISPDEITALTALIAAASQPRLSIPLSSSVPHVRKSKKTTGRKDSAAKATWPLDSWIAFRSYYSRIFSKHQQKEISGFLTTIWQIDPCQAKWTILAKSYSLIRDKQGKKNAPLNEFLAIACPAIGILAPEDCLNNMGWTFAGNGEGGTILGRTSTNLPEDLRTTILSVNDVIRLCYQQAYLLGNLSEVLSSDDDVAMAMATSLQPTTAFADEMMFHYQAYTMDGNIAECLTMNRESINKEINTAQLSNSVYNVSIDAGGSHEVHHVGNHNNHSHTQGVTGVMEAQLGSEDNGQSTATTTSTASNQQPNNGGSSTNGQTHTGETQDGSTSSAEGSAATTLSAGNFQINSEYPHYTEFDPLATDVPISDPLRATHSMHLISVTLLGLEWLTSTVARMLVHENRVLTMRHSLTSQE